MKASVFIFYILNNCLLTSIKAVNIDPVEGRGRSVRFSELKASQLTVVSSNINSETRNCDHTFYKFIFIELYFLKSVQTR